MYKALNRYGKAKWINTSLSKRHKQRQAMRLMTAYMQASTGHAQLMQIAAAKANTSFEKMNKSLAISNAILNTTKSIGEVMR